MPFVGPTLGLRSKGLICCLMLMLFIRMLDSQVIFRRYIFSTLFGLLMTSAIIRKLLWYNWLNVVVFTRAFYLEFGPADIFYYKNLQWWFRVLFSLAIFDFTLLSVALSHKYQHKKFVSLIFLSSIFSFLYWWCKLFSNFAL